MLVNMENTLFVPNSTQVPNIIFDYLMARLPNAEYKCLLYIARRTYGFRKDADYIALSQFISGVKNKYKEVVDYGTGLSRQTVITALNNLQLSGLVMIAKNKNTNKYKINLEVNLEKVINIISNTKKEDKKFINNKFRQMKLL
jgi:hypothetical protein